VGGIWLRTREFGGSLSETAGYKSGLALEEARLRELLHDGGYADLWPTEDGVMRIRSEEYEEVFAYVLHRLGIGPRRVSPSVLIPVRHRVKDDPKLGPLFEPVAAMFVAFLQQAVKGPVGPPIDSKPFLDEVMEHHGVEGALLATQMLESVRAALEQSPWSRVRTTEWQTVRDLEELFDSEKLDSPHGEYFDARFANFLAASFDEIDKIHWRQFEGLAAEFFKSEGFAVELGPGRSDGGVDIRLWPDGDAQGKPAAVLVQCKRQKAKIANTVVKALWADVVAEGSESGLVVTTSSFSPSAAALRTSRGYPVTGVERATLREWVTRMRVPGAGFFLGE
jgi:restriction system protein